MTKKVTIDTTPTWESVMPLLIATLKNPKMEHDWVEKGLMRLAKWVDKHGGRKN